MDETELADCRSLNRNNTFAVPKMNAELKKINENESSKGTYRLFEAHTLQLIKKQQKRFGSISNLAIDR